MAELTPEEQAARVKIQEQKNLLNGYAQAVRTPEEQAARADVQRQKEARAMGEELTTFFESLFGGIKDLFAGLFSGSQVTTTETQQPAAPSTASPTTITAIEPPAPNLSVATPYMIAEGPSTVPNPNTKPEFIATQQEPGTTTGAKPENAPKTEDVPKQSPIKTEDPYPPYRKAVVDMLEDNNNTKKATDIEKQINRLKAYKEQQSKVDNLQKEVDRLQKAEFDNPEKRALMSEIYGDGKDQGKNHPVAQRAIAEATKNEKDKIKEELKGIPEDQKQNYIDAIGNPKKLDELKELLRQAKAAKDSTAASNGLTNSKPDEAKVHDIKDAAKFSASAHDKLEKLVKRVEDANNRIKEAGNKALDPLRAELARIENNSSIPGQLSTAQRALQDAKSQLDRLGSEAQDHGAHLSLVTRNSDEDVNKQISELEKEAQRLRGTASTSNEFEARKEYIKKTAENDVSVKTGKTTSIDNVDWNAADVKAGETKEYKDLLAAIDENKKAKEALKNLDAAKQVGILKEKWQAAEQTARDAEKIPQEVLGDIDAARKELTAAENAKDKTKKFVDNNTLTGKDSSFLHEPAKEGGMADQSMGEGLKPLREEYVAKMQKIAEKHPMKDENGNTIEITSVENADKYADAWRKEQARLEKEHGEKIIEARHEWALAHNGADKAVEASRKNGKDRATLEAESNGAQEKEDRAHKAFDKKLLDDIVKTKDILAQKEKEGPAVAAKNKPARETEQKTKSTQVNGVEIPPGFDDFVRAAKVLGNPILAAMGATMSEDHTTNPIVPRNKPAVVKGNTP